MEFVSKLFDRLHRYTFSNFVHISSIRNAIIFTLLPLFQLIENSCMKIIFIEFNIARPHAVAFIIQYIVSILWESIELFRYAITTTVL